LKFVRGEVGQDLEASNAVIADAQAATASAMTNLHQVKGFGPAQSLFSFQSYSYLSAWMGLARATLTA
jgi:hypothetical protein